MDEAQAPQIGQALAQRVLGCGIFGVRCLIVVRRFGVGIVALRLWCLGCDVEVVTLLYSPDNRQGNSQYDR